MDVHPLVALLVEARHEQGLHQSDLAEVMGVRQETISRVERGANIPLLTTVERHAEALGYTLIYTLEPKE